MEFKPLRAPALGVGLGLRIKGGDGILRFTHLFKSGAYVIPVRNSEDARYARRPTRIPLSRIEQMISSPGSSLGTISLPTRFLDSPPPGSERMQRLESAWGLIEPLVRLLEIERNLSHDKFSTLIRDRADRTGTHFTVLRRLLLRYYYFGRNKYALLSLPPGPTPSPSNSFSVPAGGRRGPQSILSRNLGPNQFVVSEYDISDMMKCLKRLLRDGPTYLTAAHEEYLREEFRERHPEEHERYVAGQSPEPVTCRQFRYYLQKSETLDDDIAKNLRVRTQEKGYRNRLRSRGPGEAYEIDATGGRIALVLMSGSTQVMRTPYIYLLIDRWSRYILGIYVTLKKPSYEELRMALLTSFTSRDRYRFMGFDVDDDRMPIGVPPAFLIMDRGSDFLSESMQVAGADDLKIDLTYLPPYAPDAKAIVERVIRELKRRMANSPQLKGVFADRPLDPDSKRARKKAFEAATESIFDLYRVLLKIVDDHNNRPHTALKRRPILAQAGVKPIPREAYVYGLKNITGLKRPPLTDEDFYRMLLSTDHATLSNGVLRYPQRAYEPANQAAADLCDDSPRRARKIRIKIDKGAPYELFVSTQRGAWGHFKITAGSASELAGVTLDEEEALAPVSKLLAATADHEGRVERVRGESPGNTRRRSKRSQPTSLDRKAKNLAAKRETLQMKRMLTGREQDNADSASRKPPKSERWAGIEEDRRLRAIQAIRQRQGLA